MESNNLVEIDSLWNYNDPASSEIKFKNYISKAEESGNKDYLCQLLTQAARSQGLQLKFDEAHKTLDEVLDMLDDTTQTARIRYLLERGRVFNSSKVKDNAKTFFKEAYNLAKLYNEDYYAVDAAHMMGIAETEGESLRWNEIAIKDADASEVTRAKNWLGPLLNNTGWTYHDMGNYEKAMELFEKCRQWHEERNTGLGYFIARWTVARSHRSLKDYYKALEQQMTLKNEMEEKNEPDGFVYEEIGENLLALDRKEESKQYFKQAYDLLSTDIWLNENERERLERIKSLSE
jgi:tetratricopeptide (TPR) repeat protein